MTIAELPYSTAEIFPPGDFAFTMRFRRGDIATFFGNTSQHQTLLAERRNWLKETPHRYAISLPEAEPILIEAAALARSLGIESTPSSTSAATGSRTS